MPAARKKPAAKRAAKKTEETAPEPNELTAESTEDLDPRPYKPRHLHLQNAGLDQVAAEKKRQAELAEERRVGLLRTAGQPVT